MKFKFKLYTTVLLRSIQCQENNVSRNLTVHLKKKIKIMSIFIYLIKYLKDLLLGWQ